MTQKNSKPIRILIYEPYSIKVYGNTRYIIGIFKYINGDLFEPILASPFEDPFLDIIRSMNGRCMVVPTPARLKRFSGVIMEEGPAGKLLTAASIMRNAATLAKLIIKERIDVVQCHSIRSLCTIGLAIKITRRRCFWYIKGELDSPFLDKLGFALADRVLFQSEVNKKKYYPELIKKYNKKIHILRNGIDLDEVVAMQQSVNHELKKELHLDKRCVNIAFLGQLYPPKGVHDLLDAMSRVRRNYGTVAVYLVGDYGAGKYQDYKSRLDSIISAKGLDKVFFLGWRPDAIQILSLMDIYVLPSLGEGVPRSIMEAMALGKPVVATDVGGISTLLRHGETGFIVKPRDPDSLADAIMKLVKDGDMRKRFGEKGRNIAFENYSIKDNVAGLESHYLELSKRTLS